MEKELKNQIKKDKARLKECMDLIITYYDNLTTDILIRDLSKAKAMYIAKEIAERNVKDSEPSYTFITIIFNIIEAAVVQNIGIEKLEEIFKLYGLTA